MLVGRGVPSDLKRVTSRTVSIQENQFPTPDEAVEIYQRTYHGHITEPSVYSTDLLQDNEELQQIRYDNFNEYHNIELIFAEIVNGTTDVFRDTLLFHISESTRLFAISYHNRQKSLAAFFSLILLLKITVFDYEINFEKDSSY